ncbi:rhomboid family intramembrane serine protease [Flavobacterium adhaerens]|uniref:rhomboid family intramembrane serine protease n=1 Tax=Flavobacterium adhaerens TaxID=3149043 RepID=UPI0032B33E17
MAFGLPSSYSQYQALNKQSKLEFAFITIETFRKLNWNIIRINETELIAETQNNSNTWTEYILIDLSNEDVFIKSWSDGNQIYDSGKNKKNVEAFLDLFYEVKKEKAILDLNESIITESIAYEKTILQPYIEEEKHISTFYSFFSPFIPVKDYFITPILININILIFLLMTFSGVNPFVPEVNDIIDWGGNFGQLTIENNWWRLFTACFIHIGIIHLIMNCYALAYVGLLLEPYLKKWGFVTTYILLGLLSSLCSLYWNSNLVSAGASGAIFGMYGILFIVLCFGVINKKIDKNLLATLTLFITINVLGSFKEGIDGAAHIGGLCFGLIIGVFYVLLNKKRPIALVVASLFSVISGGVLISICKDTKAYIYQFAEYQEGMQDFVEMEKLALESYHGDYFESKEHVLYMIKERGIYYWEENINLLKKMERLSLPENLHEQNKNLIKYCELRVKSFGLSYKKINENSTDYDNDIDDLNEEIQNLITLIQQNSAKQSQ